MVDLKLKRIELDISQLELSIRARVSRWRLGRYEKGVVQLRDDEVKRISIVLRHAARVARSGMTSERRAVAEVLHEHEEQVAQAARATAAAWERSLVKSLPEA